MKTIFVAALKEETPELSKFYHTGVGKINASIKLMELIYLHKPTHVINYGTAGSFKREIKGDYKEVEVRKFYGKVLPNLGWKEINKDLFRRENEIMEIKYMNEENSLRLILLFSIFIIFI